MSRPVQKASQTLLQRLRFPQLFILFGALFVADLFIPDFVPFIDEIMLGVLTVMTAMWKKERSDTGDGASDDKPAEKNVTPE